MAAKHVAVWLCLLAVPAAAGQALDPDVRVDAVEPSVTVAWNGTVNVHWIVTNAGPLALDVQLELEDGAWAAELSDASLTLASGTWRKVSASLPSPGAEAAGGPGQPLTLTATATDGAGRPATDSATVQTTIVAKPAPTIIPPPPADTTARDASIAVAALVVPAVIVYTVLGMLYQVHVPRDAVRVLGVHGAWVHVRVRNKAPWTQTVLVGINRPSAGWQVAGNADRVTVPPRGEETFTVFVRRLGAIDDPERLRVAVRSRRSAIYPWRRHGSITIDSEPIDLSAWSAKKIQAALEEAAPATPAPA